MRVTSQMLINRFLDDLHANLARAEKAQAALTSGRALRRPSDDPIAASRALQLREVLKRGEQYQRNIESARAFLSSSAAALSTIVDYLQRARELAVMGSSDTLSESDRAALGNEAEQILRHVVSLGNTKHLNTYVFGGTDETSPPFTLVELPVFSVTGPSNTDSISREIDAGERVVINIPGNTIFPEVFTALSSLTNAAATGTSADIRATISQIDAALEAALAGLTGVGAKLNRLDAAEERAADVRLAMQEMLSETEDTDVAEAVTRLAMEQAVYQAALATGGRILQRSLLDYLQ